MPLNPSFCIPEPVGWLLASQGIPQLLKKQEKWANLEIYPFQTWVRVDRGLALACGWNWALTSALELLASCLRLGVDAFGPQSIRAEGSVVSVIQESWAAIGWGPSN